MEINKCFMILNLLFVVILLCDKVKAFEPISITAGLGYAVGSYLLYKFRDPIKRNTICKLNECCNDDYILGDFAKLRSELDEKLYGQHIALDVVTHALVAHWKEEEPQKALTLSFHGWPGSGKNYVTQFIKNALYKEGSKSKFVHHFVGRIHFPLEDKVDEYSSNLQTWITGNVTKCERSLFIFDEVDKMPPRLLNAIKPFIDHYDQIDNVNYRKAIFIFLSNTGSTLIKDHMLYLWKKGVKRKDVGLKDFEPLITKGAFNEIGGFHHSDTIKSNLIDHYIPFFPMQHEHVELCILDQFKIRGIHSPDKKVIEEVMSYVEWGPPPENLYSTTGCKRLSQKVALVIQKYKLRSTGTKNDDL